MSSFLKVSSSYHEAVKCLLGNLTDVFNERLNATFVGLDVELNVPADGKFSYERAVKGKVHGVNFWLSSPAGEIPMAMCKFEVHGQDQFGAPYKDLLRENELITKIPWGKFTPPSINEIKKQI